MRATDTWGMGKHTEKVLAGRADDLRLCVYANLAVVVACLADYLIFEHPYALETLAVLVVLINGWVLWQQHHDLTEARKRDLEDMMHDARVEAARDVRLKSRGFR
jgi:hypothetical protein